MRSKVSFVVFMILVGVTDFSFAGERGKPVRRETVPRVQTEVSRVNLSWEGVGIVILHNTGVVEVNPGETMRNNTMSFDQHWTEAELKASLTDEPEHYYRGVVAVTYDVVERTWAVSVDDKKLADFARPAPASIDREIAHLQLVVEFFDQYLVSDDPGDEPAGVVAAVCPVNQTCCTPGNNCCIAGQGDGQVRADCAPGSSPSCSCSTNGNGTTCLARCIVIMA